MPSFVAYIVFMASMHKNVPSQYTLRNVPTRVDQELRRRAREEGKSLNQAALEALERGVGLQPASIENHSFDDLSGAWVADPECEEALGKMRLAIDWDLWQ